MKFKNWKFVTVIGAIVLAGIIIASALTLTRCSESHNNQPTPTSINVYGAPTINGVVGTAGNTQYTATDNNGESLTSPTWSIPNAPAGVSISSPGLLSWTASAAAGAFTINCAAAGLTTGTLQVTLKIIVPPALSKPIPFTSQYFTWTTSGDALTVTGLRSGVDLSDYDTLQIPATYTDTASDTYFITAIETSAFDNLFNASGYDTIINLDLTTAVNLTIINNVAFNGCSGFTGSLIISGSVTSIGGFAFSECSGFTGSLTIPNSVTSIGLDAFRGCSGFNGTLTIGNSVSSIAAAAFLGCSGLNGTLTIPDSVTSIGSSAFYECLGLTGSLTIPDSVTFIDVETFYGCSGLTGSLIIPDSVTSIDRGAFSGCSGFTGSLTIPNFVTSIGSNAFDHCSSFGGTLTIGNSVTNIDMDAFSNTKFTNVVNNSSSFNLANNVGNAKVLIPASSGTSLDYEDDDVVGCIAFGQLTIPNSVTSIGDNVFNSCSGFTGTLTIPNSVTSIGESAFDNCLGFNGTLTIDNSVTSIGESAFSRCSGIDTIDVSTWTNIPTIGADAFVGFNSEPGTVIVPSGLGITISTFLGLPDTWQLEIG